MKSIEEKKKDRLKFMAKIFEVTGGSRRKPVRNLDIGNAIGLPHEEINDVADYLRDEGLINWYALGGMFTISHLGIKEMEESLSQPDVPTEHFPSYATINFNIKVEKMVNSQIQQGTINSQQTIQMAKINDIKDVLILLEKLVEEKSLKNEQKEELKAEINTIKSQINSPKPKFKIINESLKSVKILLTSIQGISSIPEVIEKIISLLDL